MSAFIGEWEERPYDREYDLEPFFVECGGDMPTWAWNAIIRGELRIEPQPEIGDVDWARPIRVVKTGELFPLGSMMMRGDLLFRSI